MSGPSGRRGLVALGVFLVALTWSVVAAAPASAHAYVVATTPSNGAEVKTAPTQIRVTFDEAVTLPSATHSGSVIDSAGKSVDNGSVRLVDGRRTLVIGVRVGLPKGSYIASWSVISADTHPVGGSLQFGYGVPAIAISGPAPKQPSSGLELVVGFVKGLLYLGLIIALGLVPAALVLGADAGERRTLWRVARAGAVLAILASLAQIVAQYLWDASAVPGGATWSGLRAFAGSDYSAAVFVRLGLLVVALAALAPLRVVARGGWRLAAWGTLDALLALAVLGSVVHNGHGGTGAWWRFVSTLVHVSAVVAWLGGLAVLGWLFLRRRVPEHRLRRLPSWSRYAAVSVALLVLSGVLQALVQVRYPGALVDTTYGFILIVKVALVAGALLLGLFGNRWIRRQLALADTRGDAAGAEPGQTARLRTRVRAEAGVGAVIVIVSGVLSSVVPAETAYAPARVMHAAIGPYEVTIRVAPARRGPESFRITAAATADSAPLPQSIQLDIGQRGGSVQALPVSFPYRLPGAIDAGRADSVTFVSPSVNVPGAGTWTGTLTVVTGPTEQYADDFDYQVL
ncbi:copper resistance CopC/CopD family protein [uncultured Jatrophihabitans sp.]|uniref:copper resistance CopC/CopD family protein n=1 Tax=uncultured Jatrophihabitans sp. TaxID=1610747 RepID=UPI0035CB28A5